jgi:hypothetical protein
MDRHWAMGGSASSVLVIIPSLKLIRDLLGADTTVATIV